MMAWSPCLSSSFARSLYYGSFYHALHRSLGNSQKILLLSILYICIICKYIKMNIKSLHQNYNCRFKSNREVEDEEELALQFIYLFYNTIRKKPWETKHIFKCSQNSATESAMVSICQTNFRWKGTDRQCSPFCSLEMIFSFKVYFSQHPESPSEGGKMMLFLLHTA